MTQPVNVTFEDDLAWIVINNPPVNATSNDVRAGLMSAIDQVQGKRLAILKCEGRTFIAGGDMSEFDHPPQEPHLPDVVNAIENSATPIAALLHGNVLGGGFEIAMACAYRLAAPGTKFGLPEVKLGLIPGAGGTQRAPRLLGWEKAVDLACLGKIITAEELFEIGGLDGVHQDLERAARLIDVAPNPKLSQRTMPQMTPEERDRLKQKVIKSAKGEEAPLLNFEALEWAIEPFAKSQPRERDLHLARRKSEQSRALRHLFFTQRDVTKPALIKGVNKKQIEKIAVVGGGLMGCGIAAACLTANYKVCLIEQDQQGAEQAKVRVIKLLDGALTRHKITKSQFDRINTNFSVHISAEAAHDADLAIEAVFEDQDAKKQVFAMLDKHMRDDAILATNTSYLNPEDIFADISYKYRCVGIHFFSPAHIMKLVEIVKMNDSSAETLSTAFSLALSLGKTPVLSGICDGFIGNRILAAYRRGAEYLLADGATPLQVDDAMRAFGMAMGPFETQDLTGLQIGYANRRRQDATRDKQQRYVHLADTLFEMGREGQRTQRGWYRYEDGQRHPIADPEVDQLIRDYAHTHKLEPHQFTAEEIQHLLVTVMANEGALIVEEAIAESDAAIDVVKTQGYGFPRWRGGPAFWAHQQGADTIKANLSRLEQMSPNSWQRAQIYS